VKNRKTVIAHPLRKASWYGILGLLFLASCRNGGKSPERMLLRPVIDSAQRIYETSGADAALRYMDAAYATAADKTPRDRINYYYFKFLVGTREHAGADSIMAYADSMLLIIRDHNLEEPLANDYMQALYAKGDALFSRRQYNSAFEYYFRARTIGRSRLTDCEDSFGIFYRRQEVLANTALSYDRAGMTDSALKYFNEALQFISQYEHRYPEKSRDFFGTARGVIYGNMGQLYLRTGRYHEAQPLLEQSIAINTRQGHDNHDAALACLKLAQLYRETGQPERMAAPLQAADTLLRNNPDPDAREIWHRHMAWYYEQERQPAAALMHINRSVALGDSLLRGRKHLDRTDILQRMSIIESQNQIALLKKNNDAKRFFLYFALVMMIMGAVIALLIYLNWRRSRRYIRTLTRLNLKVRQQRNRLQQALRQLETSHKEKDKILRVVAHDLRSPVAGISALTDLLLQDPALTLEQRDNLELIRLACEGSLTLSKEILDATGDFEPEKWAISATDMGRMLENHVGLLRLRAKEKQQEIMLSVPEQPVEVYMSSEKISRVIDNVIVNAIKFSPQDTCIEVCLTAEAEGVLVTVKDQGIGIPAAISGKVFDMFTEAKRYGTTGEKPYGLGLSISRQIVEAHGGKIWFESTPGEGSLFLIRLPYLAKIAPAAAYENGLGQSR